MSATPCRILTIAPYRILPPDSGGHWAVVSLHDALGRICRDHILGTEDNGSDEGYSFKLHPVFPARRSRYIPVRGLQKATDIALRYQATYICCEHPYMAPLAVALSRRLQIPWVLRAHNVEADRFRQLGKLWWRIFYYYERYAMRAADAIFFLTQEDCSRAIRLYNLPQAKCHLAPYGTNLKTHPKGNAMAKQAWAAKRSLDERLPWMYFLGVHHYTPNAEAVAHIVREVYPRLAAQGIRCEIIIAGKGLPEPLQAEIERLGAGIRYAGFIDDLDTFIKACDIMLNPLTSGGGVKTKAIEALAYNKIVVSTLNGAAGILPEVCGSNLIITPDADWDSFAAGVKDALSRTTDIPAAFYRYYSWDAIAQHVTNVLAEMKAEK